MKTIILTLTTLVCGFCLATLAHANGSNAIADQAPKEEVLFIGDSWVTVPCFFDSIDNAFFYANVNMTQGECLNTSHIGANADNFKTKYADKYNEVMRRLKTRPYIKAVYMSLGGNDMFKYWVNTMGATAEAALYQYIKGYVAEIISDIHAVRPDVWILVSGYDNAYMYANNPISSYRNIFEHMGSPTTSEVYGGFKRLYDVMATLAGDHTVFQQHVGVMHYYYGVPEAGVAAYKTLVPWLISPSTNPTLDGGIPGYRNNKYAMAHIFNYFFDPHHLRPKGFTRLFEHAISGYIGKWLMGASYQAPSAEEDRAAEATMGEVSDDVQNKVEQMLQHEYDNLY